MNARVRQPNDDRAAGKRRQASRPWRALAAAAFLAIFVGACGDTQEELETAIRAYRTRRPKDAIRLLQALESRGKRSEDLYLYLGLSNRRIGKLDKAEKAFQKAIEVAPESGQGHFYLGDLYRRKDKLDLAKKHLGKATTLLANDPATWNALGLVCTRLGKHDLAIKHFNKALDLAPKSFETLYNLGETYRKANLLSNARGALEKAQNLSPDRVPVLFSLGETYFYLDRFTEARRHYARLLAVNPSFTRVGRVYYQLGRIYYAERRYEESMNLLSLARRRGYARGTITLWEGKTLLKQKKAKLAYKRLLAAKSLPDTGPEADYYLGIAATRLRRFGDAYKHLQEALRKKLPPAELHAQMGVIRLKQHQHDPSKKERLAEASKHFSASLKVDPTNLVALFGESQVAFEKRDFQGCLRLLDRVLATSADFPQALLLMSLCFYELKRPTQAIPPLERYRIKNTENPRVIFFLAQLLARNEKTLRRASELFLLGLNLDPADHYARLIFSGVLARQGRFRSAADQLAHILRSARDAPLKSEARRLYDMLTETLRVAVYPGKSAGDTKSLEGKIDGQLKKAWAIARSAKSVEDRKRLHESVQALVRRFQELQRRSGVAAGLREKLRKELKKLVTFYKGLR